VSAPRVVPATPDAVAEAGRLIRAGRLVAFPTETVYGLGCDATDDRAVALVFAAKGRPEFNPLIVHVGGREDAARLARFDARADALAAAFWPGALTLVLPRAENCPVSLLATAGLDTVALRAPSHAIARALIAATARPIAAPSANRSGEVSPTTATHVAESLGEEVALILDGGPCPLGLESAVLDLVGAAPAILRPGAVTEEAIAAVVGPLAPPEDRARPAAPGMLARHYATRLPLRLAAREVRPGEALLAFGPDAPTGAPLTLNLSPSGNLIEAAANLFAMMRTLDRPGLAGIAVMPIPEAGLGRAINDRLRRAAAPG
jgi:L-threonylcarbamoyladenylate synthase